VTPTEQMGAAIKAALEPRIEACQAKGNKPGMTKWATELRLMTSEQNLAALVGVGFDPTKLNTLAVYAAMKVRRMVAHMAGTGQADPYTETLVKNALAVSPEGIMPNGLMTASLDSSRRSATVLPNRRKGSRGTAATQACSTRAALEALGAGRATGRAFQIIRNHPVVEAIAGQHKET
jgi:hypothetical protein